MSTENQSQGQMAEVLQSQDIADIFETRFSAHYTTYVGGDDKGPLVQAAIDLSGIYPVVIDAVAGMLKTCLEKRAASGKELRSESQRGSGRIVVRRRVREALNNEYGFGGFRRYNGEAMVESILKTASESTPQEIEEFVSKVAI